MNKKNDNKGFSLVELIIVIAIMAILVGVLAPQFIKYVERSRQSADLQTVQELRTAIEVYASGVGITNDITITVKNKQVTVTGTGTEAADAVGDSGLSTSASLKSDWGATGASYVFSKSNLNWGTPASLENSKDPKYNMKDVFQAGPTSP